MAGKIGIEAIERADIFSLARRVLEDRARPEAPLPIGLAIVETRPRMAVGGLDDSFENTDRGIEEIETGGQCHDEPAAHPRRQRTDIVRCCEGLVLAGHRVEAMDRPPPD